MEAVVTLNSGCTPGITDGNLEENEIMEENMLHCPVKCLVVCSEETGQLIYLITHTNKCTYICYLINLKFT